MLWIDTLQFGIVSNISVEQKNTPEQFLLQQNYPNPFNPVTMIRYQLPMGVYVELSVYNILGQKVATLVSQHQAAGNYNVSWEAVGLTSGIYYYRLDTDNFHQVRKMILMK